MNGRVVNWSGWLAGMLSAVLAVSLLAGVPVQAAPAWQQPKPRDVAGIAVRDVTPHGSGPTFSAQARAVRGPRHVSWPKPGVAAVDLSVLDSRRAADSGARIPAEGLPVRVGRVSGPDRVVVTVFDQAATRRARVNGVLLSVGRADGQTGKSAVDVEVDYSGFGHAYGGGWASRLRLVQLPSCAVSTPHLPSCQTAVPLSSVNDPTRSVVSAAVPLDGSGPQLLALLSGPGGDNGDYTATDLTSAGTWQVSQQSGAFSWSYPLRMPPALGGPAPSLSAAYSSGSVDGRTGTSNNQGGWIGDGWSLWPGFIERKYASCVDDNPTHKTGDQCWFTSNATLSLNGRAGELIETATPNVWRLKNDDGTRVQRLTDPARANGDNDNEYWKVTTTDGTQYFFGYHRLPGWAGGNAVTNSTWTVPVFGNNSGEPCYDATFASAWCMQAWRWNLDYVVDPHGNSMAYFYSTETGAYGRDNTPSQRTTYHRGGYLSRIEYGMRHNSEYSQAAPLRVMFTVGDRCLSGCWSGGDPVTSAWPDTPWDQYCAASPCTQVLSPTFWSAKRLTTIKTQIRNGAGSYADVESWALRHEFLNAGNNEGTPMWLRGITRTGHVTTAGGAAAADPEITFDPGELPLPNRVDGPSDGRTELNRWRIKQVFNESGGQIVVTYSGHDCTRAAPPTPHTNTKRCMPSFYAPPGDSGTPTLDWFHKYVVTRVDLGDTVTDQPPQTYFYDYLDDPAWHYTDDEITKDKFKTWGQWRGYGRVRIRTGDPTNSTQTSVEYRYLRGMHGDKLPTGTRAVSVGNTWNADTIEDHEALAGFLLQQITYNGVDTLGADGPEVSSTLNTPWKHGPTATRTRNGVTTNAWVTNTGTARQRTTLAAGGFRYTTTATTFNNEGLPTAVDDAGDETSPGDETCTRTSYARNDTTWMIDKVSQVETLSVACANATTPATPSTVLSRTRTFYDNTTTWGNPPAEGDPLRVEELESWSGSTPIYVPTVRSTFDGNGRVLTSTDAENNTTTTAYTTAHGGLVTHTTVTNALTHQTETILEPAWGLPTKTTDANNVPTEMTYDGLGRLTQVWLPDRSRASFPTGPSLKFTYLVRNSGGPTAVTTDTLIQFTSTTYKTSTTLLDGFLRTRQTQTQAPGGGRTLTDTHHNTLGQVAWTSGAYYDNTGTAPSTTLGSPSGTIPAVTEHVYDGAGRETDTIFKASGAEAWRTVTAYAGDRVHVTPPDGGTATTTITDARGRTTELRQYKTFADIGSSDPTKYVKTTYTYTLLDQITTATDQLGNTWSYDYDLRGRQTQAVDPDKGTTTTTYTATGQPETVTSPLGTGTATLAYTYDALGRKTTIRDNTVTGTIRVQWVYDTLTNGIGKLTSATRHSGGNTYTNRVNTYDVHGRPTSTSVVMPSTETGLCASAALDPCVYTTTTAYRPTSAPGIITIPAAAGLPSENMVYGFNEVSAPTGMFSPGNPYVNEITYNKIGQAISRMLGDHSISQHVTVLYGYDEPTRRLVSTSVVPMLQPEALNYEYTYDDAGNITKISDTPTGGTAGHQCFTYDHLRRLTEAWTPTTGDCSTAPSYAGLGGPAPYWRQYTFDAIGNRLTEVNKMSTGDTTYTHTHPTSGPTSVRPHAVTNVTASGAETWTRDYTYDNGGNTATRPTTTGATQTLTWNPEGRLDTLVQGANTTSYIYDAEGNRLIRKDPDGSKTLYLPDGTEVRYDQPTATSKATRYYTHAGVTVAVRTAAGGLNWIIGDHHGTAELTINSSNLAQQAKRRMLPYGQQRGTTNGTWPASMDKGFVGGTNDPTQLTHIGARPYDPTIGRFISVDPIMDPSDPQQIHRYAYSNNSPATFSDPSGLRYCGDSNCNQVATPKPGGGHNISGKPQDETAPCAPRCKPTDDPPKPPPPPQLPGFGSDLDEKIWNGYRTTRSLYSNIIKPFVKRLGREYIRCGYGTTCDQDIVRNGYKKFVRGYCGLSSKVQFWINVSAFVLGLSVAGLPYGLGVLILEGTCAYRNELRI